MADDAKAAGTTSAWVTPELAERRRAAAAPFKAATGEIEELSETGAVDLVPLGKRVLCRAVLAEDAYAAFVHVPYDARKAIVHEVIALGDGVARYWDKRQVPPQSRFAPGDLVYVLSTVADRLSKTDRACRLWTVDVRDVSAIVRIRRP